MKKAIVGILILLVSFVAVNAFAQYKVYTWENFESGQFPAGLQRMNNATTANVQTIDFRTSQYASLLQAGNAKTECGNYGMIFTSNNPAKLDMLTVVGNVEHDRTTLGAKGKAIVQADFFIPSDLKSFHFASLIAKGKDVKTDTLPNANYRLGINPEGTIFFSYFNSKVSKDLIIRKDEDLKTLGLKTPGWHRLQMVFLGQDKINMYVDGKELSFSPITEPTVKYFNMGLMMAGNANKTCTSIVDNLSIQVSLEDDAELPISPWVQSAPATAVEEGNVVNGIRWFYNTEMAFNYNKTKNMNYLLLFYFPSSKLNQQLEQNLISDPETVKAFGNYCNIRLDINQLGGGYLADRYNVVKFPTIIIVDPQAKEKKRIMYFKSTPWTEVLGAISNPN